MAIKNLKTFKPFKSFDSFKSFNHLNVLNYWNDLNGFCEAGLAKAFFETKHTQSDKEHSEAQ